MTSKVNGTVALVVLTNNDEGPLSVLHTLSLRGWSIVPLDATAAQLQAAVVAAAQGLITLPAAFADRLYDPRSVVVSVSLCSLDEPRTASSSELLDLVRQGLSN